MKIPFDPATTEGIIAATGRGAGGLVPILLAVQREYRYLPEEALRFICEHTEISPADMEGVVSFYPRFRRKPAGRHLIQVCVGTACHVRGALDSWNEFHHQLSIPPGEDTDRDRVFTVEKVACLGCCMLAPAVRIGRRTYGRVTAAGVPEVLEDFLTSPAARKPEERGRRPAGEVRGEVRVCLCTSCRSAGSEVIISEAAGQIRKLALPARVRSVGCTGLSSEAPLADVVLDDGRWWRYGRVEASQVPSLLLEHFRPRGIIVRAEAAATRLLDRILAPGESDPASLSLLGQGGSGELGLTERQHRVATLHAGELDPLDLDSYVAAGGFSSLARCRDELAGEEIIDIISASGLRGRGGGGYPTGRKWRETRQAPGEVKHVVCNGDEGDPGAFMDRMILESFPFRVIEGMAIAALAVGARRGVLYIRGEYSQAIDGMREAIDRCIIRRYLIPAAAPAAGRAFSLEVFEGAGAYVCGEETALLESMEGRRGTPRLRPPFPSENGLRGTPTLVNNVETFALVPAVISGGPEAFASLGTPSSKGTKSFALAGKVRRGGLIEVPMGISLRDIVEEVGGGLPDGRKLKAVQVGGPSGGCVPAALASTPVDYEALGRAGAIMGSGGMIVLDEGDCMVDLARYFTDFARRESCGKCSACRVGTFRMFEALDDICGGRGKDSHLSRLEEIGEHLRSASLCGLGRMAPNTVLSTLRHFRGEYLAHLGGRCPSGRCKPLIRYTVSDHCIGCTRCAQRCPAEAVTGEPHRLHLIDDEACTRCDICRQVCPVEAVEVS
jgi:NADH-quinone oxidoreductase subunit F